MSTDCWIMVDTLRTVEHGYTRSMIQFGPQKLKAVYRRKVCAVLLIFLLGSCSDNTGGEPEKAVANGTTPAAVLQETHETKKHFLKTAHYTKKKNYRNGTLNGVSKEYYNNGKLRYELLYEDGKLITENEKLYYTEQTRQDGTLADELHYE